MTSRPSPSPLPPPANEGRSWPDGWLHALTAGLICLLVLALAGVGLWQEHVRQRERSLASAENMARLLEVHVSELLGRCDAWLRSAAILVAERPAGAPLDSPILARSLQVQQAVVGELRSLRVTDDAGRLLLGEPMAGITPAEFAAREDFRRARSQPDPGLIVTGPTRDLARGDWVLTLTRAVRGLDNRFLGVVMANLPVRLFGAHFSGLELGPRGAAALRTDGLALVFRQPWPGDEGSAVGSTEVSRELRQALAARPAEGRFVARGALDGIERIHAYRKVRNQPLTVIVGLSTADLASTWNWGAVSIGLLGLAAMVLAIVLPTLLYRHSRRELDMVRQRFDSVVGFSRDAVVCKSADGLITRWSPGAEAMYGYTEAEMIGRPITQLLPPERFKEDAAILDRVARGEPIEPFDTVRLHKDGRRLNVSVSVAPLSDTARQIVGASTVARDVTQQKELEETIRSMAINDPLTHLPNRRLLLDRLEQALALSRRNRSCGVVIYIDLDHFKQLNDEMGQEAGDRLLVDVASWLRAAVRQTDTVARLGGDEFVVVCGDLGQDPLLARAEALALVDKVEAAITRDVMVGSVLFRCRASIGHRVFDPSDEGAEALLRDADLAMYATKTQHQSADDAEIRTDLPQS